jgi:hypothetical protein
MTSSFRRSIALAAGLLLATPVLAQAPFKPASPTATRPAPATPAPATPASPQQQQIRQKLATHPIKSTGPSQPTVLEVPKAPPRVYGRTGQLLHGMKQAGPNRVLDTRTGRYYDAVPSGDGVRIKP